MTQNKQTPDLLPETIHVLANGTWSSEYDDILPESVEYTRTPAAAMPEQVGDARPIGYVTGLHINRRAEYERGGQVMYHQPMGTYTIPVYDQPQPVTDTVPRAVADKLAAAVRKVVHEGVQETEGDYPSHKNNKCKHGNFGFEGCGNCTDDFLELALTEYQEARKMITDKDNAAALEFVQELREKLLEQLLEDGRDHATVLKRMAATETIRRALSDNRLRDYSNRITEMEEGQEIMNEKLEMAVEALENISNRARIIGGRACGKSYEVVLAQKRIAIEALAAIQKGNSDER